MRRFLRTWVENRRQGTASIGSTTTEATNPEIAVGQPQANKPETNDDAREISDAGIAVLGEREGLELTAYQDTEGYWTIGYGHSELAGSPPVPCEGMTITENEALEIFDRDLDSYEATVRNAVTAPMEQHQFDAFTSICFNIGRNGFATSTFVERFNAGASTEEVCEAISWWDTPDSIISRRNGEICEFRDGHPYIARIDPLPPPLGGG